LKSSEKQMLIWSSFPQDQCIDFAPASFLRALISSFLERNEKGVEKPYSFQDVVYSSFGGNVSLAAVLTGKIYQMDSKEKLIVSLTLRTPVYPSLASSGSFNFAI
jgi:hypothetical protein